MACVLIVDDEPDIRAALAMVLSEAGHEVVVAGDGQAALDIVAARPPDLVLLDIAMPGIDGLETLRRLKSARATAAVPVVMMSANGSRDLMVQSMQYGVRDYISKPWERGEVELVVKWALEARMKLAA